MDHEKVSHTMRDDVVRSLTVFPGGSNGEFNLPPDLSIVIDRGEGARLWDTSGREFHDFSMGWGSVLVGHARAEIAAAVREQTGQGSNFAYTTAASLELASRLVDLSPACDKVRFCASGTEATMYCIRLARAATGRQKILKFEGAYHGSNDVGVTSLFPSGKAIFPHPEPTSAGVESAATSNVLIAPFNDLQTVADIIRRHRDDLAGIIVEPLHRCLPPMTGFLSGLRELATLHDVPLIFDEVVTGFRLAYGGAQEYYGVVPDLVAYGKALGGGYPIGVYGGSARFMDQVTENQIGKDGYVWTASTLGGNPVTAVAALAALEIYRHPATYAQLHHVGAAMRSGMREVLERHEIAGIVIGDGPLAQVVFTKEHDSVTDYRKVKSGNTAANRDLMLTLFSRGIFLNPMGTKLYLSLAHGEDDIEAFMSIFDASLIDVADRHHLM